MQLTIISKSHSPMAPQITQNTCTLDTICPHSVTKIISEKAYIYTDIRPTIGVPLCPTGAGIDNNGQSLCLSYSYNGEPYYGWLVKPMSTIYDDKQYSYCTGDHNVYSMPLCGVPSVIA